MVDERADTESRVAPEADAGFGADEATEYDANVDEAELLYRATRRLSGKVLGTVLGLLSGLALFGATLILVIKGGPNVGEHLGLLRNFFPGYSVTVGGSIVGLVYGTVTGFLFGWFLGWIYNTVVGMKSAD